MGLLNKIDDWTHSGLSKLDDGVNDAVPGGWATVAAVVANMMGVPMPISGGEGAAASSGFEFLPSGEMTVFSPETAGATSGGTNFLSSIFGGSSGGSGEFIPDLSGQSTYGDIGIDPDSMIFDSNMGTYDVAEPYYGYQYSSPAQQKFKTPDFGNQAQQQLAQQLGQLNQGGESGGMKKGQAIPTSVLASLLDPKNAVKAYRPTLL